MDFRCPTMLQSLVRNLSSSSLKLPWKSPVTTRPKKRLNGCHFPQLLSDFEARPTISDISYSFGMLDGPFETTLNGSQIASEDGIFSSSWSMLRAGPWYWMSNSAVSMWSLWIRNSDGAVVTRVCCIVIWDDFPIALSDYQT